MKYINYPNFQFNYPLFYILYLLNQNRRYDLINQILRYNQVVLHHSVDGSFSFASLRLFFIFLSVSPISFSVPQSCCLFVFVRVLPAFFIVGFFLVFILRVLLLSLGPARSLLLFRDVVFDLVWRMCLLIL